MPTLHFFCVVCIISALPDTTFFLQNSYYQADYSVYVKKFQCHRLMKKNLFVRIFRFYYEGFRGMTVGKKLWVIILVKLFIMFAVLRIFFFENYLGQRYDSDRERAEHVLNELTQTPDNK